jgi:hypothetical protein
MARSDEVGAVAPALARYTDEVVLGGRGSGRFCHHEIGVL